MRLADVLKEEHIIPDLRARSKNELLEELVEGMAFRVGGIEKDSVLKALLDREKLGSTGIGHGVAIPHGRVRGLGDIKVFFGRSRAGVDFDSMDRQPVFLFFIIISPENTAAAHLKLLAGISHLLKSQDLRLKLMKAPSSAEIFRAILDAERRGGFTV